MLYRHQPRRGAHLVECAVVYPVVFTMLFGLLIGGLGVFRYQEVASLAREGARYASVHGSQYQSATGKSAATADDVYNKAVLPKVVILDPGHLHYNITWSPDNKQGSQVTVKLSYDWVPEAYLGGITLSSTSTMPMSY